MTENYKIPGNPTGNEENTPAQPDDTGYEMSMFTYLELLRLRINRYEAEGSTKTIEDIPADILAMIMDYYPATAIHSFIDYIEWTLDIIYKQYNEPDLFWLSLFFEEGNEKIFDDIAGETNIPVSELYILVAKRLLKDLENNFDAYDDFLKVKLTDIDLASLYTQASH